MQPRRRYTRRIMDTLCYVYLARAAPDMYIGPDAQLILRYPIIFFSGFPPRFAATSTVRMYFLPWAKLTTHIRIYIRYYYVTYLYRCIIHIPIS